MITFDRFDICEAYWCYAVDYNDPRDDYVNSIWYRLDRMEFNPAPTLCTCTLEENGKEIYDNLVRRKQL